MSFPRLEGRADLTALFVVAAVLLGSPARAQVGPEESAKQLKPADGLEATLWASEPMVVNPTTIDIDSRGRVWVTEGLNYRLTRRGNRRFERIEDADKIKILEDTDGDGKADKMTVFADKIFPVPMGIAVEENWSPEGKYLGCKVYVGNSPDLLVFEDTDGDDKADKRYPLLTGFGGIDSDHGVHGMFLGFDGKLYFTHGDGCCSVQPDESEQTENFNVVDRSGRHVRSDQLANTLRVNRDGTQMEILADRQRNNYETAQDSFGHSFTSDNDDDGNRGSRVIWVMDGGNYGYRTPGSPRHWGEDVPGIVPKLVGTGNGSPCGIMVYEGDLLPEKYRGAVLEAEAGPRVIYAFPITREGAAFRTKTEVMLASDDPWFRPVDVTAAPDGSLFVADWYDAGVGGHAFSDQTTGRIFRVAPEGSKVVEAKPDYASIEGLMAALDSPNVATRDVAQRLLLLSLGSNPRETVSALSSATSDSANPRLAARAHWTLSNLMIVGDRTPNLQALESTNPELRELAIRIMGRDLSRVGAIDDPSPDPIPAAKELRSLLPLAKDEDAGVRRELILAFRNLPTSEVGDALRTLTASWDGRDRWYLEALGLALRDREPEFLESLFDGTLYGDLETPGLGKKVAALPPYFPVDRNEAYLAVGEELPPANALSKTLGLAWALRRVEALPTVVRLLPMLGTADLNATADAIIEHVNDPAGAAVLAGLAAESPEPARRRQALASLARKLEGDWRPAANDPAVVTAIESALADPDIRSEGLALAGATGASRYAEALAAGVADAEAPPEVRASAIEALARVDADRASEAAGSLIDAAIAASASNPAAEAAVRVLPRLGGSGWERLDTLMIDETAPLGLRREALRAIATLQSGPRSLLRMAGEDTLPADLRTEAAVVLRAHPDRNIRDSALETFPIKTADGRPLPSIGELVRREGDADRGREVFFTAGANACGSCHRVQGRGQWVGPDLSTIGTKYGRDALLRQVLNPSEAISYNFRSLVLALSDGRVLTGLPVEERPERITLKLADGQRVEVQPSEVEARRHAEISLMPEGLAEALHEQELVDLLAYMSGLRAPVSIVGVARATASVAEPDGETTWTRVVADAEGRLDLAGFAAGGGDDAIYVEIPITSNTLQDARLVLDGPTEVRAWLDGQPLELDREAEGEPLSAPIPVPEGSSRLRVQVPHGGGTSLVVTIVADEPVEFRDPEGAEVR